MEGSKTDNQFPTGLPGIVRHLVNQPLHTISTALVLGLLLTGCEQPFLPETSGEDAVFVVEGYIESGPGSLPAYVTLAKSLPFYSTIDSSVLNDYFVRGAAVSVDDGDRSVALEEVCLSDLPAATREEIRRSLGILGNFADFCLYIDLQDRLAREEGRSYALRIEAEGTILRSTTTIPPHIPIDSFRFDEPPGKPIDTLARMYGSISDLPDRSDFYRYFTAVHPRPLFAGFGSVTDDAFFDGKNFEFPITRHPYQEEEIELETFGLFTRGDSITVKWCNLDQDHFNFWNTLEFNSNNQGPFSTYTRIDSNIEGGIGIWGGYSISFVRTRVPGK